jgi:hypothetical protein
VVSKTLWGEERVTVQLSDGTPRSVPVSWTDFLPEEPYWRVGRGRCLFRAKDLLSLADLISGIQKNRKG